MQAAKEEQQRAEALSEKRLAACAAVASVMRDLGSRAGAVKKACTRRAGAAASAPGGAAGSEESGVVRVGGEAVARLQSATVDAGTCA